MKHKICSRLAIHTVHVSVKISSQMSNCAVWCFVVDHICSLTPGMQSNWNRQHKRQQQLYSSILDVVEATANPQRALAHSGVLKSSAKLAAHETAHLAICALGAEPSSLSSCTGVPRLGHAQACWMKRPQAGAFADQQLCDSSQCSSHNPCCVLLEVDGKRFTNVVHMT